MSDEEFAILKRLVEKRSREAAQAQVTVTPVDTVQHCSPCPLNPEMPADVRMRLESNEGKMDPELKEYEPPSAGTSLETPGQQCPPNERTWETGRTTSDGFLTAGVGSNQGGDISSPTTEHVDTRAVRTTTATFADISSPTEHVGTRAGTTATPEKRRHKTASEDNNQFDPGVKGEKASLWHAAITLFFLGKALGHGRLVAGASCFLSVLCVCLSALFFEILIFSGDHFSAS